MKEIRKIREWINQTSWFVYPILLLLIIICGYLILTYCKTPHTSIDNARYMLITIIQSEATILAIVVTLSLVAVQLIASSYSPKIIEIFEKNPSFLILISSYIISIIYGLWILKILDKISPTSKLAAYEISIHILYFLGVFCLIALIPYILNTIKLLKPSTLINKLSQKITFRSILIEAPIEPIIVVSLVSIKKNDYKTAEYGINIINSKLLNIFKKEDINKEFVEKIYEILKNYYIKIGQVQIFV